MIPLIGIVGSGTAGADASGCTLAPGPNGAQNCVQVYGSGVNIGNMLSQYLNGWQVAGNVCYPDSKFYYTHQGNNYETVYEKTANNCGYWYVYIAAGLASNMKNNSRACTSMKNSSTGGRFAPLACETIHS
jgi:hypothetical protein